MMGPSTEDLAYLEARDTNMILTVLCVLFVCWLTVPFALGVAVGVFLL